MSTQGLDFPHHRLLDVLLQLVQLGLPDMVPIVIVVLDRLEGLDDYIEDELELPLAMVARYVAQEQYLPAAGRRARLISRLAHMEPFRLGAQDSDRNPWDPTQRSLKEFMAYSTGRVIVYEPPPHSAARTKPEKVEKWLRQLHREITDTCAESLNDVSSSS